MPRPPPRVPNGAPSLALFVLVVGAFSGALTGPAFWDDPSLLMAADRVNRLWDAFLPDSFGLYDSQAQDGAKFWRPLVTLSFHLERLWVAPPHRDLVHHGVLIALHGAATLGVYDWLLRQGRGLCTRWELAALALVWAVLPLKAENVAWISGRGDVLGAALLFAGLSVYARLSTRWSRVAVAALTTTLAVLCKEVYVVAPGLFLIEAEHERSRRGLPAAVLLRNPAVWGSALVSLAFLVLRIGLIGLSAGGAKMLATLNVFDRVALVFESAGYAWRSLLFPWLPRLLPGPIGFSAPGVLQAEPGYGLFGVLGCCALLLLVLRVPASRRPVAMLILPLLPVLNIVPTGLESRFSDRYLYLPSLGLLLLAAMGLSSLKRRFGAMVPLLGIELAVAAVSVAALVFRVAQFADPNQLWKQEASYPDAAASVLDNAARAARRSGDLLRARDLELRVAVRYAELGFAAGFPHALAAARAHVQYYGASAPDSWKAYALELECLTAKRGGVVPVPFSPEEGRGVRLPCEGEEVERFVALHELELQAELLALQATLGHDGSDGLRRVLQSPRASPPALIHVAEGALALDQLELARAALGRVPEFVQEKTPLTELMAAMDQEPSHIVRLFLAGAFAPACARGRSAATVASGEVMKRQRAAILAACGLSGRPQVPSDPEAATQFYSEKSRIRGSLDARMAALSGAPREDSTMGKSVE